MEVQMDPKEKISLSPEEETLLITLFAKSQPDNPLFFDQKAQEILSRVDYDFTRLRVPYKTVILVCQRVKKIDAVVREFINEYPKGVILHLGCGLDSRFSRVDNGQVEWYDLDLPSVIKLRQLFFSPVDRCHLISSSVPDLEWLDQVKAEGKPVLVVAEGLLMYLGEEDVKRFILKLRDVFPGCRLIGDVFSRMTARSAAKHASLRHTGASIGWGIDDPHELEKWSPGIRLIEEWYFSQDPDLAKLNLGYRLAYKLAGRFKMVNRAHRIISYQL